MSLPSTTDTTAFDGLMVIAVENNYILCANYGLGQSMALPGTVQTKHMYNINTYMKSYHHYHFPR